MSLLQPFSNGFPPPAPRKQVARGDDSPTLGDGSNIPSDSGGDPRGTWLIAAADQERRRRAAQPNPPSNGGAAGEPPLRFWTTDVNRHYLEAIAERESRGNPNYGYGAGRPNGATGRYQLTPLALRDAGWFELNKDGTLVPVARAEAFGVRSLEDLRSNAPAQEEAMRDISRRNEEQATGEKLWDYLGRVYQGRKGQIVVTPAGIAAAAHRWGAPETKKYFEKLAASGWDSNGANLNDGSDLAIETRLREFQAVPYTPYTQRVRDRLWTDPENDR